MKKPIRCDNCETVVGEIEEETHVVSVDVFYGIEIICKRCKKIEDNGPIENQLLSQDNKNANAKQHSTM